MELLGLDHVQIAIPRDGESTARAFYTDVLGMKEVPKPAEMAKRGGAWFVCGEHELHVGVEDPFVPARKAHPAFRLESNEAVVALAEHVHARGHAPRFSDEIANVTRFHLDDPFGNRLEFTAPRDAAISPPELRSDRLLLRLPVVYDAKEIAAHMGRNLERFLRVNPVSPQDMISENFWQIRVRKVREEYRLGRAANFFLFRNDGSSRVIGSVSLTGITRGPLQSCYLGYGIDEDCEGQGLMREAVELAVRYAFEELQLHRVQASYLPSNERSGLLLKRLGFTAEGYARDYLFLNGAWRDHVITSKLSNRQSA